MTFMKILGLIVGLLLVLTGGFCVLAAFSNNWTGEPVMLVSLSAIVAGIGLLLFVFQKPGRL
jgi:hypothetical protein